MLRWSGEIARLAGCFVPLLLQLEIRVTTGETRMYTLEVLNPVAVSEGELVKTAAAPRPETLAGKKVGLLWNTKRGGNIGLERVGELLKQRHSDIQLFPLEIKEGATREMIEQVVKSCDVTVGSTGD